VLLPLQVPGKKLPGNSFSRRAGRQNKAAPAEFKLDKVQNEGYKN